MQQTTQTKFYRLYSDKEWLPVVKEFTPEEEAKVNPEKFATPDRYDTEDKADMALFYYVSHTLSMARLH